ncbi:MAG: carboxypeptidase-like regulatory domain-containing protein [Oscillospiraceae bacterium]
MSAFTKFYFRPGENEQIETTVRLTPDQRSAIHGSVRDLEGRAVKDALVLLFETGSSPEDLKLTAQAFTDDLGQFVFGPLSSGCLYLVKIFKNMIKLRDLEIRADIYDF